MKRSKPSSLQGFNADASVDETVFDALGRKIKVIHPGGNSAVMAYDLASRLLSRNYFAAGSGIAESTDSFSYDLASRPVTANNADASISYSYDSIGRRSSLTQTLDGLAKTVNFVYDAANRLLSRSPEGLAVESRSFTNRGQLASVSFSTGLVGILPALVASFSYDAVGRETSRTYGNGLNTTSTYSRADNLITSITVANKPELSFGYSYDSNKNVTAEQRGGSMALYSWNATFDAMDRLNSQNDGAQTRSWNLDLVGNTTSETLNGTSEARTLNAMHAPTAAGNKAYSYDSNGQMTAKPGYTLVWDARNHLVSSSPTGSLGVPPAAAVSYRYDAFGNRVSKGATRYLLVDNQVLAEFNGSASKQYCYGSYIDEVLAEKGSEVAYYHRNRQYNTSALTDSSGSVLEMYSTDAMGRVKAFDAAATAKAAPTATTVLFTGRVFDAETGLYYFRARYFEPELGVFISRDPLGFVDGYAVYQGWFGFKMALDPDGTLWWLVAEEIGAILIAAVETIEAVETAAACEAAVANLAREAAKRAAQRALEKAAREKLSKEMAEAAAKKAAKEAAEKTSKEAAEKSGKCCNKTPDAPPKHPPTPKDHPSQSPECLAMHAAYKVICAEGSCKASRPNTCDPNLSAAECTARATRFTLCAEQRSIYQVKCGWKPGDPGYKEHMDAIADATASAANCTRCAALKAAGN